jgi:peptide deformylase
MTLPVAQLGQPILRRIAEPVPFEAIRSSEVQVLLADMRATLDGSGAVGLAAPQVFVGLRIFLALIRLPEEESEPRAIEAFINPTLSFPSADKESAWEGCLSFPELMVWVPRHRRLRVDFFDAMGESKTLDLAGFPARVVQHEYDHLDGILTIDRAASTRDIIKASEIDVVKSLSTPEGL